MAKLYFRVASDWEEVVRLRQEIDKLKATLKTMDSSQSPAAFKNLNNQLSEATQRMDGLVTEAAKAGAKIEGGFKKKIFDASQVVNGLSEKITLQRGVIQQLKNELAGLKGKYKEALKVGGNTAELGVKIKEASERLIEQKNILFDLTQQQANARLNVKKLRDEYELYKDDAEEICEKNEGLAVSWKKILAVVGGAAALRNFANEIVRVRGEFQQLEIAFSTMLKSKEKADALMSELVNIAAKTPFDLQGVASSAKQMLAYGSSAENVGKELVMLGNIAAGVGAQLGDIAYLYGTLRTQGRAYAVDIRQFAGRGIPIYEELAKVMGVTKDKVSDLVKEGKVGFPEVEKAFQNMTNSSGIYYNLMEEQSKSLTGQISNLGDAWDSMLNDMGKQTQGAASMAISAAKGLVENYETVGKIISGLILTYGAYRTAIMLATIAASKHTAKEVILKNAKIASWRAQKLLNAAMLSNPYVAITAAVVALGAAMWAFSDKTSAAEKAQKRLNQILEKQSNKQKEQKKRLEELNSVIENNILTEGERIEAFERLKAEYPQIFDKYLTETEYLKEIAKYKKLIADEDSKRANADVKESLRNEERKLQRYRGNKTQGIRMIDTDGNGWAETKVDEAIAMQMQIVNKLKAKAAEHPMNLFLEGVKEMKSEDISSVIDEIELSLKALGNSGKDAIAIVSSLGGEFSKGQLSTIKSALGTELESRKKGSSYKDDLEKVKKEWEDAKKNLETIEKDKAKFTSKQYKEAKENAEAKEKAYKELGGSTKEESSIKPDDKLKNQEKLNTQLLSLQRKNQQDEINLMEEGAEKRKAQADFIFQQALNDLETQAEEWRKVQGGNLSSEQIDELNRGEENAYQTYLNTISNITQAKKDADEKAWQDYYIAYGEYQEKRKAIEEKYNEELSKTEENSPQYMTIIAERKQALDELDETLMKDSGLWGDFFSDFSNRSSSAINALMKDIERLIAYMEGIEGVEMPDIFKDAEKSIKDAMSNPDTSQKFVKNLKGTLDKFNKMVEKDNPFKKISEGFKNKDSKSLADGFSGIASAASELGSVMEGLGVKSDSALGKATSALSSTASMAAQGAAIGGPWGAAAGAALGLATSLVGMFGADYSQYNSLKAEYEGLIDIWDSLISKKQQYIDIDYGIEAQKAADEAKKLVDTQISRQRQLAEALMGAGKSAGSHSLGYRVNDRMGSADWRRLSALTGSTIKEVADVFRLDTDVIGKVLQDEKFVSVLTTVNSEFITYIENIEKYGEQLEEIAEQEKEAFTGTSFDEFRDSFISMLSDLDSTSEDFADNFEKHLQNAIFSSLIANKYKDRIQSLYDSWAKEAESGGKLDSTEAERLNAKYQQLVNEMISDRNEMMNNFGWKSEKEQQSASGKGFEAMEQDTAEELNGRFTALQVAGEEIKVQNMEHTKGISILSLKVDALLNTGVAAKNIAEDTRNIIANSYLELVQISENTGAIVKPIQQMQKDMEEVKRNTSRL